MPIDLLTAAERKRLNRFPEPIPDDDLRVFFTLSDADQLEVGKQRGAHTQLGCALQLCALRYLGFAPDDLGATPWSAVLLVARQLALPPEAIQAYGHRIKTRTMHLQHVQAYLGFRPALPLDFEALTSWLVDRALEHDQPTLLLQLACDKLRREQIVRPGMTRVERLIATAREQAQAETFQRLTPWRTPARQTWLDGLLAPEPDVGRTRLTWLRQEATSHAASQILATLEKILFLKEAGVAQGVLADLTPNRLKWRAQGGWRATPQQLQRMPPRRRYPIRLAVLHQARQHHTDVAVELYDQCLGACYTDARQELEEFRHAAARSANETLIFFQELGQVLLDPAIDDAAVRAVSFQRVPEAVLRAAVADTAGLIRPRQDAAIDFFGKRYSDLRQCVPAWRRTRILHAQGPDDTEWPQLRPEVSRQTGTPSEGLHRLQECEAELVTCLAHIDRLLARKDSDVRIEDNRLVLTPREGEGRPASAEALADELATRLPRVDLSELLIEVDTWTHVSTHWVHATNGDPVRPPFLPALYASVVAQACNFGLDHMAQSTDLAYERLAWCTTWYLREDTLKTAFSALVNDHHQLPLSQAWGSGMLSSSDGQRFPVTGKTRLARPLPRSFAYGLGVTFYSWSSDQLSQDGTKAIPATVRDAPYVLDELCDNETELAIVEHTTDTHGCTDIRFALFDLLGFRFTPRLRDLSRQRLYTAGSIDMQHYPRLQPHVRRRINRRRILEWWDEFLRVAGSLKLGWVTASLFVQKLQTYPRKMPSHGRCSRMVG